MGPKRSPIKPPIALIILDGWGRSADAKGNAILQAHTPYFDALTAKFASADIISCGRAIGQEKGSAGNPEAGHLALGTGRPAQAEVSILEKALRSGKFQKNKILKAAFERAAANRSSVHLIGLLSDGGVHSSTNTLFGLLRMAKAAGLSDVNIHAILDGVDVPTRTADVYIEALEIKMAEIGAGRVATLCGRYFGMDSRENWERTARVFTMLVHAEGERSQDAVTSIRNAFLRGIADEFIAPVVIENEAHEPLATVKDGDLVIYFNHRPETIRQLVRSLSVPDSTGAKKPLIETICMTEYDASFELPIAFPTEESAGTLSDALTAAGVVNLKLTQTERYPHLSYFFNGARESQSASEQNILIPTPKNETLDLAPESQSFKIADRAIGNIGSRGSGVFVVNFPAATLVAETGNFERTVESVQFVDTCLGGVCDAVINAGGIAVVTASHARCEQMLADEDSDMPPRNSSNRVPFIIAGKGTEGLRLRMDGSLVDVAPTLLSLLSIERPPEMTGSPLF
ncbi:MAG: 2,3-bisphosphoglycerate-independent phosphoglycerate mutase [Acidobacteria bacterium]|nr:2,3-bisphosphoglycerate-independent phosphoglycerate mutase [Acidobacteriota bacterium]